MHRIAAYIFLAFCTLLPTAAQTFADRHSGWMMVDFRAYYCAALSQREGRDPYLVEPLHTCETATPFPFYRASARVTVPAPYPPYALALLAPLTFAPFRVAVLLWCLLLAACVAAAAWSLSRIIGQPFSVGWAAFALALGLTSFPGGNAMPVAVAMITLAALFQERGKTVAASVCIALAMIEPNVALPGALGLFVAARTSRVPLILAAALLGALSLFTGGLSLNLQYVQTVLPAHALSEVSRDNQYSLSTVVAAFGTPDRAAAAIGALSYAILLSVGVIIGNRLSRRYASPAFAIAIPTAFALIGGSFVHTEAIAAAVPGSMMLLRRTPAPRIWTLGGALLVSVPWMFATSAALFLAPIVPVAFLARTVWPDRRALWLFSAVATFAIILALFIVSGLPHAALPQAHHNRPAIDPRFAESAWRDFVLNDSTNRLATWLLRFPTWIGLIIVASAAVWLSRGTDRDESVAGY